MSPERIAWAVILAELREPPYNIRWPDIAKELGLQRTAIYNWALYGTQPKFESGDKIIKFYLRVTGKTYEELPRR